MVELLHCYVDLIDTVKEQKAVIFNYFFFCNFHHQRFLITNYRKSGSIVGLEDNLLTWIT